MQSLLLFQRKHQRHDQNLSDLKMHAADIIGINLSQRRSASQPLNEATATYFCQDCRKRPHRNSPCKNQVL